MLSYFVILLVTGSAMAQRSPYLSNSRHPSLLPRFRPDGDLGNRVGDQSTSTTTLSPDLQGTLHDPQTVQRVSEWPEDKQPYWYKNRHVLNNQRQQEINGNQGNQGSNDQTVAASNQAREVEVQDEDLQQRRGSFGSFYENKRQYQWNRPNTQYNHRPQNFQQSKPWANQYEKPNHQESRPIYNRPLINSGQRVNEEQLKLENQEQRRRKTDYLF